MNCVQYHWLHQNIAVVVRILSGLDVFWNGPVEANFYGGILHEGKRETKPSTSATHFGKL